MRAAGTKDLADLWKEDPRFCRGLHNMNFTLSFVFSCEIFQPIYTDLIKNGPR